ncbi:MAG TPA: hypothetical protein VIG37_19710 [Methylomirabilota bacterium]|jgi:hypothetical protein
MPAPHIDLTLPDRERALVRSLLGPWRDLLYVPGPGLTSAFDPGAYRSSLVIVPAAALAVRVASLVAPAFGSELCRLRFEALPQAPGALLGSFFDLSRTGVVYALAPERGTAAARAPDRAEWRYGGESLASHLAQIRGLRLIREHGRGAEGSWTADRGLAVSGADGVVSVLLAVPAPAESALFLPAPGFYRPLLDAAAPPHPGATVRDLLGYGDDVRAMDVSVERIDL